MSMIETTGTILDWDVTTVKRAGLSRDLPSGNPDLMWVANSSTLIYGERDAILHVGGMLAVAMGVSGDRRHRHRFAEFRQRHGFQTD